MNAAADAEIVAVLNFWKSAGPAKWFSKDDAFDREFRNRFLTAHFALARREHDAWLDTAEGFLAAMILLDQFPRNAFRGSAHMFATDPLALHFARTGLSKGFDEAVEAELRVFCYLPFEHSENLDDQERCVELCSTLDQQTYDYAKLHLDIIRRFGRFPHRNAVLGRKTTAEEQAFLDAGGFAG
jgi:uncharacterized protein (DUF924 family)